MGTRGTYGFREDGTDKLTYNHFDSYPDGLGDVMIEFIKASTDEQFKQYAEEMIMVDSETLASPAQIESCKHYFDESVGNQQITEWYGLLRKAQGEPMEYSKGLHFMIDNSDFVEDSLFCEYGYIINVDEGVLEFYEGFNKNPDVDGRYAACEPNTSGYVGIELRKTFTFAEIREGEKNDLLLQMRQACRDYEEDEEEAV